MNYYELAAVCLAGGAFLLGFGFGVVISTLWDGK